MVTYLDIYYQPFGSTLLMWCGSSLFLISPWTCYARRITFSICTMKMGFSPFASQFGHLPVPSQHSALHYHTGAAKWGGCRGMVMACEVLFKLLLMLCHKTAELTWRNTVPFCIYRFINVCDWILSL